MTYFSSWLSTIILASSCYSFKFKFDKSNSDVCPYAKNLDYCLNSKLLNAPICTLGEIESINQKPYFILEKLLHEPFFRYFKVLYTYFVKVLKPKYYRSI